MSYACQDSCHVEDPYASQWSLTFLLGDGGEASSTEAHGRFPIPC